MAQSYAAVVDGKKLLIVKKREVSNWWFEKKQPFPEVVNGAGQWALPGGGANPNETPIAAALREFEEETGVQLDTTLNTKSIELKATVKKGENETEIPYFVNIITISNIEELCEEINKNIKPANGDASRPAGKIKDWELDSATFIEVDKGLSYLGCAQEISPANSVAVADKKTSSPSSQAIDWYAEMAKAIQHSLNATE